MNMNDHVTYDLCLPSNSLSFPLYTHFIFMIFLFLTSLSLWHFIFITTFCALHFCPLNTCICARVLYTFPNVLYNFNMHFYVTFFHLLSAVVSCDITAFWRLFSFLYTTPICGIYSLGIAERSSRRAMLSWLIFISKTIYPYN